MLRNFCCMVSLLAALGGVASAVDALWTFSDPDNRLAPVSGTATLEYFDPDGSGWGPAETRFGKASALGLPPLPGGDADVMAFPAATPSQGYLLRHGAPPNGPYGKDDGLVSNYTIILDVLFPADSDGRWRGLWQTDVFNGSDAELFAQNLPGGGIGINSNYRGSVRPDTWHRIVFAVRAAPGEGQARRYIDGQFVGAIGTTGSGLDVRFALDAEALLFTDNDNETAPGYVASVRFVDRALSSEEIAALGGPHAAGAVTPGAPPPELSPKFSRYVGAVGHRGGSFGEAPDNTLAALRKAIADGAAGVEVDTRLTADGVCVCVHDETVDRTTNSYGYVADMTLAELKALDAGSWYDPSFAGEKIPTLEEVLAEAKGKIFVYLDLKVNGQADAIKAAVDATGFPPEQLWCWTPGDPDEARAIREKIPNAAILWGNPDEDWATNPTYFSDLRELGVIGFSIGAGNGTPDPAFVARAKQEGFVVEIYTVLDPDAMRRAAAAGVDFVETDFPAALVALNPPRGDAASLPFPADGATEQPPRLTLAWVGAAGATRYVPRFGTVNPPPALPEQRSDMLSREGLLPGTTYYWSVDSVVGDEVKPGPVWRFTTEGEAPTPQPAGLWTFDDPQNPMKATVGADLEMVGEPVGWSETAEDFYGVSQSGVITTIHGRENYLILTHGIPPNGGGQYVNEYSLLLDLCCPPESFGVWRCLFQTAPNNGNDGDYFIRNSDEKWGVAAIGYSSQAPDNGAWHRAVLTFKLSSSPNEASCALYLDGELFHTHGPDGLGLDGRFSLDTTLLLFADEDDENAPLLVGAAAIWEGALTEAQVRSLGGPGAPIDATPPPVLPAPTVVRDGNNVKLTWPATPGVGLERSTTLKAGDWTPLNNTIGAGEYSEPLSGSSAFFRLRRF